MYTHIVGNSSGHIGETHLQFRSSTHQEIKVKRRHKYNYVQVNYKNVSLDRFKITKIQFYLK